MAAGAAADVGRALGDGDANDKLAVIELADHNLGQIEVDPTGFRQIYLAQLDRVEGHWDLVNG